MTYTMGLSLSKEQADAELAELAPFLNERGIVVQVHEIRASKIIMIADEQLHLLPTDEKGPYFGDEDSGHSIYKIDLDWWRTL